MRAIIWKVHYLRLFFERKSLSNTLFIEHILQKEILGILILIYRKYSELWTAVTKNHLGNALIIQRQYETLFKARQMVFKWLSRFADL